MKTTPFIAFNLVAIIFLFNHHVFGQMDRDKLKEVAYTVIRDCQAKASATDNDLNDIKNHKVPNSNTGGCFLECIFQSTNIMSDGKYNKDGTIAAFGTVLGDGHHQTDNMKNMADTCEKEIGDGNPDKCKTAIKVAECFVEHSKTHGFDLPTHH